MGIIAYLNFNGNCREAMDFYKEAFKGEKLEVMTFGDMPPREGVELDDKTRAMVAHGNLEVLGTSIMFSDMPPGQAMVVGNNIHLNISLGDVDELKSIFDKLKVNAQVITELGATFWTKAYGYLIDKYGVGWMFNYVEE